MSANTLVGHAMVHAAGEAASCAMVAAKYVSGVLAPLAVPTVSELISAHQRGWITDEQLTQTARLQCVALDTTSAGPDAASLAAYGQFFSLWTDMWFSSQQLPTEGEYREISNRYLYTPDQYDEGLKRYGYIDDKLRAKVGNLRFEIPSSSDLVRFSVRHVFEPDLIAYLGYNDEFKCTLDFWHRLQGLNYPIFTGPFSDQYQKFLVDCPPNQRIDAQSYIGLGVGEPTWAQAFWWSHWVLPSPTQGYLAYFRLRPDRDKRFDGPEALGVNFSYADLQLLLRANDYPPKYRAMLAAIARPIPGVRFAREFRRTGVYDEVNLFEWALRQGYSDKDAGDIATDIDNAAKAAESKETTCRGCNIVEHAYEAGVIDRATMEQMFLNLGVPANQAGARADLVDVDLRTRRAREVVATVRKRYLSGAITAAAAQALLGQYGLVASRIDDYLADWELEKSTNIKQISAQKAIKWACQGLLSIADLVTRLTNLGYAADDIAGMIAEAQLCAATLAARAAAAAARAAQQTQRALIQAQKQAAQAIQQARRALASHGSPAQLRKWFCEGSVGAPEVYARLEFLGWPDIDISRLIADCKKGPGGGRGGATGPGGTAGP